MRELEAMNAEKQNDRLRRLIGYIKRFIDALDYNKFKTKDYPIGSGYTPFGEAITDHETLS